MYADGALAPREAALLWRHAATCAACHERVETLKQESELLRAALKEVDDVASIPSFVPPPRARDFVVLVLATALIGAFSTTFWNTVAAAIPSGLKWLNPLDPGELLERAIDVVAFILNEGAVMWTSALNFAGVALLIAFAGWIALGAARPRAVAGIAASLLALAVALPPSTGHAFERREGTGLVTVAANETVDDTLLVTAQTVVIDGTITGDLLAFARSVTVRGNVAGNLITAAETVTVEGTIGGSVIGAARGLSLSNARVGRDLYGFGRDVEIGADSGVSGNAIVFGERVDIDGRVGVDFAGFGSTVTISGAVEGDVEGFAETLTLLPSARVGGNVTARVDSAGDLTIAQGAVVGGTVNEQLVEREQRRNRYLTVGHYVRQIVRLGAAFLVGLLLLWAVPVLRDVSLPSAGDVLRSGGIGLAAAVTLPVAAFLVCITIVGLPLGILGFVIGLVGLYLSKIVIAQIIGRAVFRAPQGPPHYAATLITGLVIVIVAINLPLIGGLTNFVLTLVGFGVIVTLLMARLNRGSVA
jgi:cytoskeletal protein CcmA (bactofilin family)